MGAYQSKYELEGFMPNSLGYSLDKRTSEWETIPPKNYDYYFTNKRCTKISRKLYSRDYDRGYFYGYYHKENPIDLEKEF